MGKRKRKNEMESVGSRRGRGMEEVENGVEEQRREWDEKHEEEDKEEERETMGGGKVREEGVEEKEEKEAIKHCELYCPCITHVLY